MKKHLLFALAALTLSACTTPGTIGMMGESPAVTPAEGQKVLVGKLQVQTPTGDPWSGNVEVCFSPLATPEKVDCKFTVYLRPKCLACKEQPNPAADSGFVIMPLPVGKNELRQVRLSHTALTVGEKGYIYHFRGMGFEVDGNADVTNFGKLVLSQKLPEKTSSTTPMLVIKSIDPDVTDALDRYRAATSSTVTVATGRKHMYVDLGNLRSQVQESEVRLVPTTTYVPIYIPRH